MKLIIKFRAKLSGLRPTKATTDVLAQIKFPCC